MPRALLLCLFALLLISCASPSQNGLNQLQSGNAQGAYNTFLACAQQGDSYCMNNIGTMYENGQMDTGRNLVAATDWYTLAARYGNPTAQQNLMRLNGTIPAVDLQPQVVQQQSGGGDAALMGALYLMDSAAQGYSQGVEQAQQIRQEQAVQAEQNKPIHCTSRSIGSTVHTDCK